MENKNISLLRRKNRWGLTVLSIVLCLLLSPLMAISAFLPQAMTLGADCAASVSGLRWAGERGDMHGDPFRTEHDAFRLLGRGAFRVAACAGAGCFGLHG